jgi:PKD repeat protein
MIALLLLLTAQATEFTLISPGAEWSYLDSGVDPGPTWIEPSFDDSAWATGFAPHGYGIFDAITVVDYGIDPLNKPITNWFRTDFDALDVASLTGLVLRLRYDDAAVAYLNGVEIERVNLPGGLVTAQTVATSPVIGSQTFAFSDFLVDTAQLLEGTNTLAIEIHQDSSASYDLAFDVELSAFDGPTAVTRGPYLQQTSDTGIVIRWRTAGPSASRVWYGTAPGALTEQVDIANNALDHEVTLSGLSPDQTYFYAIGAPGSVLAGDDADHTFTTHPTPGTRTPTRVWILGDCGTANLNAAAVRDAWAAYDGTAPDVWLLLGDNAYGSGTDAEYQTAIFDFYPETLRQTSAWSTIGNHDGYSADSLTQTGPYFDIFTFPTAGELGGEPSGTEAYYSFDYANIHFVSLDSDGSDRTAGGAMLTWLDQDLASTNQEWIIAFWHHPPYSKGSHNSDFEFGMVEMRQNANPILEAYGVDLVLTGHSHSYERSYLIDQHYGLSTDLVQGMILDDSDGTRDDGFAYRKPTQGLGGNEGAVYIVAGSSGQKSGGTLDHPAMHVSMSELGSVVLDIDGDELDALFLQDDGQVTDTWAMTKGVTSIVFLDGPRTAMEGEAVSYEAYGQQPDGQEVQSYLWDLGDNSPVQATSQINHTYPVEGLYTLRLTVTDDQGADTVREVAVDIVNGPPTIDPIVVPAATEGSPVALSATAMDPSGDAFTFSWDMGDGNILIGADIAHSYDDDGFYYGTVTATDDRGAASEEAFTVIVDNADPVIGNVDVDYVTESAPSHVTASATDPGILDILTFTWDLGDGSDVVEGAILDHTFPDSGTWPVTLTVTDEDGGLAVRVVMVEVGNVDPQIETVLGVLFANEGDTVPFTATGSDLGGDPITYTWDFGDGTVGTGDVVQHAYGNDGNWLVTVTADDGDGGTDTAEHAISIANLPPQIDALIVSGGPLEGTPLSLSATASDPGVDDPIVISWDFGDGDVAEGPSVVHTWERDGVFTAAVTVTDDQGDGETVLLPLFVDNAPPSITSLPPELEGYPETEWVYSVSATDPGQDPLTWRLTGPVDAEVNDNGRVSWTPGEGHQGATFWFTVEAIDDAGAVDQQTWPVTVRTPGSGAAVPSLDHDDARNPPQGSCNHSGALPTVSWALMMVFLARRRRRL